MKATNLRTTRLQAGISRLTDVAQALKWNADTLTDIERCRVGIDEETHSQIIAAIKELSERKRRAECQEGAAAS